MTLEDAPSTALGPNGVRFGRYLGPIDTPDFELGLRWRGRLKEWHYTSVSTPRVFFAFGVVRLGYAANVFIYWVDHEREGDAFVIDAMSTGSRGVTFSESSTRGETAWRKGDSELRVTYEPRLMRIHADVVARGERLRADLVVEAGESLGLLHDLGKQRPAYTHKAAGMRTRGSVRLHDEAIVVDGSAVLDWTRSVARRSTVWKWVSFAGHSAGRHLGLNLSTGVYEDGAGHGRENALWVDGKMSILGDVHVEMPADPGVGDWVIRSTEGDAVELRFTPQGARSKDADYKFVRSRFVQPYGLFNGRVAGLDVVDVFGVVEDHDALW